MLQPAGGWTQVLNHFATDHIFSMEKYPKRAMILLIDFDGQESRLSEVKRMVPEQLTDRVFVLGAWTQPEKLKSAGLGSYEQIGLALGQDCHAETKTTWEHDLLRCNAIELDRLRKHVRPILF